MSDNSMAKPGDVPWRVVSVTPGSGQNAAGQPTTGNKVTYELTGQGTTGTVFVPAGTSPDMVASLVHQDAQNLSAIRNLSYGQ